MQRPEVSVYALDGEEIVGHVGVPDILNAPIRTDVVNFAHSSLMKNTRHPHAVKRGAGMEHSAASWGTGRAVARIPRVSGSGTSRAGQGAFGNMCRKGRMFAPIRVWRKWGLTVPKALKRYSVASSLAASCVPALVMARGHRIDGVKEIPLVVSGDLEGIQTTREARQFIRSIGAEPDRKASEAKRSRAGKGKSRSRPYTRKRGPLVVYLNDNGIVQSFRSIIGIDTMWVKNMNVLRLAPGGHVGRFIIWTQPAFEHLNVFGSFDNKVGTGMFKKTSGLPFVVPRPIIQNPDIHRIMSSEPMQRALYPHLYEEQSDAIPKRTVLFEKKRTDQ